MFGGRQDLPLGHRHIFFASCHHKDRLLSPYWRLDVGVGLGSESLYLAAYSEKDFIFIFLKKKTTKVKHEE